MKLKELKEPYKAESNLKHFLKAQDLITQAIFAGWKIDFEVEPNEEYETDDNEDYPSLVKTYVWAPERWNEDYIQGLHLLAWYYPQAVIELAAKLKNVIKNYNCPYCSMLNGVGKRWPYGQLEDKQMCIAFEKRTQTYTITDYRDFISCTQIGKKEIRYCPFCGRPLNEEEEK